MDRGGKTVGLTARELYKKSNRQHVTNCVKEQVKLIDAEINIAHNAGFNHIAYELPNNFQINNLDKADAQTLVYSDIIEVYTKSEDSGGKGFTETYIDVGTTTMLHIYWLNGMDDEERDERRAMILKHKVKRFAKK
jgi:hypothetical protein